jgi:hypothetical protein
LQALKYRRDLGNPLPGSSVEPGVDVLALLGEDVGFRALQCMAIYMLHLPIRAGVGNDCLVHLNVFVVIEV